jgi:hypothetical protein
MRCIPPVIVVCVHFSTDTAKETKSLATLTCTVLRRALPKVPLPITTPCNPFCYPLPTSSSGSSVEIVRDPDTLPPPSSPLHSSLSAPELTSSTTQPDCHTMELKETATFPDNRATNTLLPNATLVSSEQQSTPAQEASVMQSQAQTTEEHPHSTATGNTRDPTTQSDSDSQTTQPSCGTHSEPAITLEELALYDKFFPELAKVLGREEAMRKTLSSPQLQTCGGLPRDGLSTGQEGYRQNPSLCVSKTATPLVVIPTAQPLSQCSDDATTNMAELIGGASSLSSLSNDRGRVCSEVTVESVVPFVESAAPQLLGHHSKPDPEPLYNKVPSVNRSGK